MEEKKLTDEEIIYDLEVFSNLEIEEAKKQGAEKAVLLATLTLDLINRLQSENEQLRNAKTIYENVDYCADDLAKALKTISEQKAEIERLTGEKGKYQEKWQTSYMNELNLQKQVDELKKTIAIKEGYIDRVESEVVEWQFATKKAVKDIANALWNDITSYYFALRVLGNCTVELDKLAEFWHKRGVEVE